MTSNKPSSATKLSLDTFVKLMRATESVSADVHRQITGSGLTISQFGTLEALFHLGPLPQKTLAQKILKSPGNITMVIDNLEKRGLVARERNRDDRRSFIINLTEQGKKSISDSFPDHAKRIDRRMSCLSPGEQRELGRLLKKLGTQRW